ncbi:hypothetical protein F4810DRAFT_660655 [Camillea tinctor]|nr:hypothetical protein F4810DRAFT_660655 [Camillea tinctor]
MSLVITLLLYSCRVHSVTLSQVSSDMGNKEEMGKKKKKKHTRARPWHKSHISVCHLSPLPCPPSQSTGSDQSIYSFCLLFFSLV